MAMSIGDELKFEDARAFQWALFADECHIPVKVLVTEMRRMAKNAVKHIAQETVDLTSLTDPELKDIRRIQDFIAGNKKAPRIRGLVFCFLLFWCERRNPNHRITY